MKPIMLECSCGFGAHHHWYDLIRCWKWGRVRFDPVRSLLRDMRNGKMEGQEKW